MSPPAWKIVNFVIGTTLGALATYWPQWMSALKDRGGWWAVGGVALTIIGGVCYHTWENEHG